MTTDNFIRVWDIAVRIGHWALAVLFFASYLTGDEESTIHIYAGYGVLGVVAFRFLWGAIGTKYARFGNFLYGPAETLRYIKSFLSGKPKHYLGHNPVGGWMALLMLMSLALTIWSGLELYGEEGHGPLAKPVSGVIATSMVNHEEREHEKGDGDSDDDKFWGEIHELLANFTLLLVFMHIGGVLVSSIVYRENLIKAMVTGGKPRPR